MMQTVPQTPDSRPPTAARPPRPIARSMLTAAVLKPRWRLCTAMPNRALRQEDGQ